MSGPIDERTEKTIFSPLRTVVRVRSRHKSHTYTRKSYTLDFENYSIFNSRRNLTRPGGFFLLIRFSDFPRNWALPYFSLRIVRRVFKTISDTRHSENADNFRLVVIRSDIREIRNVFDSTMPKTFRQILPRDVPTISWKLSNFHGRQNTALRTLITVRQFFQNSRRRQFSCVSTGANCWRLSTEVIGKLSFM